MVLMSPNQPTSPFALVVPEEFVGSAVVALITRRGYITGAGPNELHGYRTIRAWLPASEYASFVESLASETRGRGAVEREDR